MSDTFRCCICGTHNDGPTFTAADLKRRRHKHKTLTIPCVGCGDETVQNKLGA